MKSLRIYLPLICLMIFTSCKKFVENQQEKAVMSFITSGQWIIESYLVDTVTITNEFEGYTFRFNENGTVSGTKGTVSETGTWIGDVTDYSITSNFPNADDPLKKLNGKWIVKDGGNDYVNAEQTTSTGKMFIRLKKIQ